MPLTKSKKTPPSLPTLGHILRRVHVIVALISVTTAGLFLTLATMFALKFYVSHNIELIARSVNYIADSSVRSGDKEAVNKILELIISHEEIGEVKILDVNENLVATWVHPADTPLRSAAKRFVKWAFSFPVKFPIMNNGNKVGEVWLSGHGGSFLHFLLIGIPGMLGCLLISTLFALLLTRNLLHGILNALNNVTEVAHNVSKNRAFGLRVPSAPIAEFNVLSDDFNGLLHQLEIWQNNLTAENNTLAYHATHDSLTGLANRAFFEGRLNRLLSDCQPSDHVAVLYLDCDRFKQINDHYGHASGDIVLVTIADRMKAQLRESDLIARLGGDEFAVLLAPIHDTKDVLHIADNILACMNQSIKLTDGSHIIASLSIGIALYPEHANTAQTLLEKADQAMYQAKHVHSGGCRVSATNTDNTELTSSTP